MRSSSPRDDMLTLYRGLLSFARLQVTTVAALIASNITFDLFR